MPHLKLYFLLISWAKGNAPIFQSALMNQSQGEPSADIVHSGYSEGVLFFPGIFTNERLN